MGLKKLGMRRHFPMRAAETLERLRNKIVEETKPPKFCKDCDWHEFERIERKDRIEYRHYCTFPPMLDVITGQPSNPAKNRNDATLCGKDAKHWTPKSRKQKSETVG
jgi:hypothetical protein